jgi:protein ImuB
MLWACLRFPDLPIAAAFDELERVAPCAVEEGPRQRAWITRLNPPARAHGVREGQASTMARALCADLSVRPRDGAAEQRLLRSLAAFAQRYSSHVALDLPDALLIEIGASLRLFGGWPALERRLRQDFAALGHPPTLAAAPIPQAARVFAAQCDGGYVRQRAAMLALLARTPLQHSGLSESAISLLHHVGVRTLGEAFRLPRAELARRIGSDDLAALDRLRHGGVVPPAYRPPTRFAHRVEFDAAIDAWPPLRFPLRRLCGELAVFLAARDRGIQRCELVLAHEDRSVTRIVTEWSTPQRDAPILYELLCNRLERTTIPRPVEAMVLRADDLPPFAPRRVDLFEPQHLEGLAWPELVERLRARLGDAAVCGLAPVADHRPERAWRSVPPTAPPAAFPGAAPARHPASPSAAARDAIPGIAQAPPTAPPAAFPGAAPARHPASPSAAARDAIPGIAQARRRRPLWLLGRALPLSAAPRRILAGPERIESGWWDGGDTRRDYYLVETHTGQRAWVYRPIGVDSGWMLHGWFA